MDILLVTNPSLWIQQPTSPRNYGKRDTKALKFFIAFITCVVLLKFQLVQVPMPPLESWTPFTRLHALMRVIGEMTIQMLFLMYSLPKVPHPQFWQSRNPGPQYVVSQPIVG